MNEQPNPPAVLFRGFEHLEHARAFVDEGVMRLGKLEWYRDHEDKRRRDPHEGIAELRTPDPDSQDIISTRWYRYNLVYVLCCSAADPAYVASKFGRYLVRINSPGALIADIREHVSSEPIVPNPSVDPRWVSYDRGAIAPRPLDPDDGLTLSYSQKTASFVDEQEYRIVIVSRFSYERPRADPMPPVHIFLRLNRRLSYCDALPPSLIRYPPGR